MPGECISRIFQLDNMLVFYSIKPAKFGIKLKDLAMPHIRLMDPVDPVSTCKHPVHVHDAPFARRVGLEHSREK